MPEENRFYVDVPDAYNPEGGWVTLATFNNREDAIAYCHKYFGGSDGKINLITSDLGEG